MKKTTLIAALVAITIIGGLSSCGSSRILNTKDIKYMPIRFKPLTRNDVVLVGGLEATETVLLLEKKNAKSKISNKGLVTSNDANEVMYFAPGPGEAITGSLYENILFNSVYTPGVNALKPKGLFSGLFTSLKMITKTLAPADKGLDYGYYALIEKYPEVDYFINVRFDRKTITDNKGGITQTVTVKADGLKLKTDN
jgi:hypothetical protein